MGRRHNRRQTLPNGRHFLAVVAALFALNALLALGDFIETKWALLPAQLSLELLGFLVLIELAGTRLRNGHVLRWVAASALLLLIALRIADIAVPWFFGRTLNVAVDLKYLPFFFGLLSDSLPTTTFFALLGGAAVALLAALATLYALSTLVMRAESGARVQATLVIAALAVAAYAVAPARYDLGPVASSHVAAATWRNVSDLLDASGLSGRYVQTIREVRDARPAGATLDLGGRNVLLVFVESYGTITYSDPEMAGALNPVRAKAEERLRAAGYSIYSSVLNSPITGGGSWMAHATLTTGVRIDSQPLYDVLLTSGLPAIGQFFRGAGYRTVAVMPRIEQPWPEGESSFSFDNVLDSARLEYRGARYTWETMPDQFVLERVHAREIASAQRPLFIQYVLSSSHLPFDHVPPVIADGLSIGDGRIYTAHPGVEHLAPGGQVFENKDGYRAAIQYVLESLENYLAERLDDNSLVIVLGDHQPPLIAAAATRNKAVPIHVLSKDPTVLHAFRDAGYAPGMTPPSLTTDTGMESFLPWLLSKFGVATTRQAHAN